MNSGLAQIDLGEPHSGRAFCRGFHQCVGSGFCIEKEYDERRHDVGLQRSRCSVRIVILTKRLAQYTKALKRADAARAMRSSVTGIRRAAVSPTVRRHYSLITQSSGGGHAAR